MPVLVNKSNHGQWPRVVSEDVLKHVYLLKNRVYVLAGQVKGKTSLPLPAGREFNSCLTADDMYVSFRCFVVLMSRKNTLSFADIEILIVNLIQTLCTYIESFCCAHGR